MRLLSILYVLLIVISACSQSPGYSTVSANEFEKKLQTPGIQLLDVRTSEEFRSGHLTSALQADWNNSAQFTERTASLNKTQPIYIYCLAGGRSSAAAKWMLSQGFSQIVELEGGINSWKKSGKHLDNFIAKEGISIKRFQDSVSGNKTVLVDFGASWCPPCRAMEPVLDSLQTDKQLHFELIKIDADANPELMKEFDISSLPVFIIFRNGKIIHRFTGFTPSKTLRNLLY